MNVLPAVVLISIDAVNSPKLVLSVPVVIADDTGSPVRTYACVVDSDPPVMLTEIE